MSKLIRNVLIVILGNAIYAAGVVFFILPSGLITGGTTGIALSLQHAFGIQVALSTGVFNVIMFLVGFVILGKEFALTTLVSTICYPTLLAWIQHAAGSYVLTDDIFLCALFGGVCIGTSLAIIIRLDASTGGMDIPPLILQKTFRIPVSVSMYVFDFVILIMQMMFSDSRRSLYGIVLVIVYTVVLDKLMALGQSKKQIEIVSDRYQLIREAIINKMDRGVTLLHGETGFLGLQTEVLKCVIEPRELFKVEKLIREIDPSAFIILSSVSEVKGRGFSSGKKYYNKDEYLNSLK